MSETLAIDAEVRDSDPKLPEGLPGKIHNGVFTCIGPKGHRTIKVSTVQEGGLKGRRVVRVMTGPDNVMDYVGVGFLNEGDAFKVWKRVDGTQLHKIVLAWLHIMKGDQGWGAYRVEEARHCVRCNRLLTEPTSIESGIGPVCARRG